MITANPEAAKYSRLWEMDDYRRHVSSDVMAGWFLALAKPRQGHMLLDLGCGSGLGGFTAARRALLRVTFLDFVPNCLAPEVAAACQSQPEIYRFIQADLEQPLPITGDYGYCSDVLEHIPPEKVDEVLQNIFQSIRHLFVTISLIEEKRGMPLIGEPLHLTVQPAAWWATKFRAHAATIHWMKSSDTLLAMLCDPP